MKYLLILILGLTSCTKVYNDLYTVERYPIEWDEEIVIPSEHEHFLVDNSNKCVYFESDTVCWHHYDTIVVRKFESRMRIK